MKKVLLKGGKPMVAEIPVPGDPGPLELKIALTASAVSAGTESAMIVSGAKSLRQNRHLWRKALRYARERGIGALISRIQERLQSGIPLGYSAAGIVEAVGSRVQGFAPGDIVAAAGAQFAHHGEYILASSRLAVKVPAAVSPEEAATCTLGAIAVEGVRKLDARLGETIAVIGMGSLGQIVSQIAQASGLRVIGIDRDRSRMEFALQRGWIWQGLEPSSEALVRVMDWTHGLGLDGAVIAAHAPGDGGPLEFAARLLRRRGRVTVLGNVGVSINRDLFYEKDINLNIAVSYGPGRYDPLYEERGADYPVAHVRWTAARNMACYLDLIERKKIQIGPLIQAMYPIEQAEKAYEGLGQSGGPLLTLLSYPMGNDSGKGESVSRPVAVSVKSTGTFNVGVIGAGSFVGSTHLPILASMPAFRIASVCNKHPEKAQAAAVRYRATAVSDWRAILRDPGIDLVIIGTRHNLHAEMAAEAVRCGKAVFLEKPMALDPASLEKLEAAYQENPVPFHVGFNRRFSDFAVQMKKELHCWPKPWTLHYRVATQAVEPDHWILDPEEGGGRIIGEACHMIDFLSYLLRQEGEEGKPWLPEAVEVCSVAAAPMQPTENFTAILKYPDAVMATLTYTVSRVRDIGKERVEVLSPAGSMVLDDYRELTILRDGQAPLRQKSAQDKGFRRQWEALASWLKRRQGTPPLSFEEAAANTRLTFLIDQLARTTQFT